PMDPRPDSPEARLAADYNAEMIEQIARFPRVRDRALFVGGPDDVVDLPFGPGQPSIREWTRAHYELPGYILPFDPAAFAARAAPPAPTSGWSSRRWAAPRSAGISCAGWWPRTPT